MMEARPAPLLHGLDAPAHVVVTGASAGIGLAATRQLLARGDVACVHALSRAATACPALEALSAQHGSRLHRIDVDLADDMQLGEAASQIGAATARVHLVFQAAGLLHDPAVQPEKALASVTRDGLERVFAVNAFAPVLLIRQLMPLLARDRPAVLASLSARVGSIGDNRLGGWYAYRASKAAQNQLMHTLAIELRRSHPQACCVTLHPGTVDTALSRPYQANVSAATLFDPRKAARQLLDIVASLQPCDSGRFIAWDGTDIPW
jgi:NAD(P)-dependent dehydrogenase (short-subunit alcohol dehydrogenase family)